MIANPPPTMLYKYVSGVRLLASLSLRFSPPGTVNDPFESRLPVLAHVEGTKSKLSINPAEQTIGQTIDQRYGISCFSEQPANLLLWAHYADAHAGLVIGFDTTHPEFSKLGRVFPIEYRATRPTLKPSTSRATALASLNVKSRDWRYEKEWRLITELSSCTEKRGVYLKSFSPSLIQIVILGLRASPQLRKSVARWGGLHPQVELRQARLDSLKYHLHFDENLTEEPLIIMTKMGTRSPILSIPTDPTRFFVQDIEWSGDTMILRDITSAIVPKKRTRSK